MRLLIVTQKVDHGDPILGFFHGWLNEFAVVFDALVVICLEKGDCRLPDNVRVLSLGKEILKIKDSSLQLGRRLLYTGRFLRYIWQERMNYDVVFVHMNQEYVLLGWCMWRFLRKPVALWYNHTVGTVATRAASRLSSVVLHTSPFAFTARFKNSCRMPAGVDTRRFNVSSHPVTGTILYLGRIAPLKKIEILIAAAWLLHERDIKFTLHLYGAPEACDHRYAEELHLQGAKLESDGALVWHGAIAPTATPSVYAMHEIFVNLTPRGNYDKTVIEAMSAGTVPLVSSDAFADLLPTGCFFKESDSAHLAQRLEQMLTMPQEEKEYLRIALRRAAEREDITCLTRALHQLFRTLTV